MARSRRHGQWPLARACRKARIIANGGVLDGVRYLSEASAREIGTEQAMGECPIFGLMRQGLMVTLDHPGYPLPSPTSFYWGGAGGMLCVMDPRAGLSFGYVMNHLVATLPAEWVRMQRFWKALSTVLEALERSNAGEPLEAPAGCKFCRRGPGARPLSNVEPMSAPDPERTSSGTQL